MVCDILGINPYSLNEGLTNKETPVSITWKQAKMIGITEAEFENRCQGDDLKTNFNITTFNKIRQGQAFKPFQINDIEYIKISSFPNSNCVFEVEGNLIGSTMEDEEHVIKLPDIKVKFYKED